MLPFVSASLYVVALAMFVHLHVLDRTVDWMRDPVSNFGVGTTPRYFRVYGYIGTAAAAVRESKCRTAATVNAELGGYSRQ